jgi:hypothetical protein
MPEVVVNALELVDVRHDDRDGTALALRTRQRFPEELEDGLSIPEAGQVIPGRKLEESISLHLQLLGRFPQGSDYTLLRLLAWA